MYIDCNSASKIVSFHSYPLVHSIAPGLITLSIVIQPFTQNIIRHKDQGKTYLALANSDGSISFLDVGLTTDSTVSVTATRLSLSHFHNVVN